MRVFNRTARYNYDILEKFEAGIDLLGPEVKSVRDGKISLNEAFVHLRDGEAYLVNAHIHPYLPAGRQANSDVSPTRSRKLLLHKNEVLTLASKVAAGGLTIVPLALYNKGNLFKLEIALAKGKKKWDKREAIKKRDLERDISGDVRIDGKAL